MSVLERFKSARNAALLSLDEKRIRDFCREWNSIELPKDMEMFWGAVHKAITGNTDFPKEFRKASKDYLEKRGLKSYDDGDL